MRSTLLLLLNNLNDLNRGHVRKFVMLSIIFRQYIYKILFKIV